MPYRRWPAQTQIAKSKVDLVKAALDAGSIVKSFPIVLSETLCDWLADLALLKSVPFEYLIPDPRLLPEESIRFFHIDPTWLDNLLRGALSAANIGMTDKSISDAAFSDIKRSVYARATGKTSNDPPVISGMLVRSEVVRRWPKMIVRPYSCKFTTSDDEETRAKSLVPVLRRDVLGPGVLLVLFPDVPCRVELREPDAGLSFEPKDPKTQVDLIPSFVVSGSAAMKKDKAPAFVRGNFGVPMLAGDFVHRPYCQVFEERDALHAIAILKPGLVGKIHP